MEIAIDFDGTCVTHEFPNVGQNIGAEITLSKLVDKGHKLILFTMRSDRKKAHNQSKFEHKEIADVYGNFLQDAIDWFDKHNIPLYGIQSNPNQGWTTSPKCYAHLYIDDAALGCPLILDKHEKPFVDWIAIEVLLEKMGAI